MVREAIYDDEDEDAEAGFDVTPHVLPDGRVRLEFTPFDERHAAPEREGQQAAHPAPSTTVTVAPGARIAIGARAHESTASSGSGFASIGSARPREERVLVVEVEIEAD
jgi:type II secretory pathway component HofQ